MSSRSASPAAEVRERRIALVQPPAESEEQARHAVQLFDSVLWVFKGTTATNWVATPLASADLIVVHHSEPAAQVERWREQGKLIIVLSTDARRHPTGPRTLVYPFPAAQVLSMLEQAEAEMDARNPGIHHHSAVINSAAPSADPWGFVEALRTLRVVSNDSMWLVCKGANGPLLWLQGDGSCYVCDSATASAIRAGTIDLSGVTLQKGAPPPASLRSRSGSELFWFATYHASSTLAPWLSEKIIYRLIRWPDFGRLRTGDVELLTAQIRIVAALDAAPGPIAKLAAHAHATIHQATRTLNALASCGLIEAAHTAALAKSTRVGNNTAAPVGGFKNFLRNLRKHLRLGAPS